MEAQALNHLLSTLDLQLKALAMCEIGPDWRLNVDPFQSVVCHFVVRGSGYFETGGSRTPISEGTIIIVPPGTQKSISGPERINHEVCALDICDSYTDGLLAFRARSGEPALVLGCAIIAATCGGGVSLFEGLREPLLTDVGGNGLFAAGFDVLLQELTDPNVGATVVAECLMKQALVFVLREQMSAEPRGQLLAHLGDPRIVRAAAAMIKAPERPHSIGSLSELAGMSRSSFIAHFVEDYSKTPGEFLQDVRMHSAARLLVTSELPIKCLAVAVGYASRSQFSRAFKLAFGLDPSTYRMRAGVPDRGEAEEPLMDPATAAIEIVQVS